MPLNAHAKAWLPPGALSQQLKTKSQTGDAEADNNSKILKKVECETEAKLEYNEGENPRQIDDELDRRLSSSAGKEGSTDGQSDELQFEEGFEKFTDTSSISSHKSTPRTSLVGPSPLPSPLVSPHTRTCATLMKQTDKLSRILNEERAKESEETDAGTGAIERKSEVSEREEPTVRTHVETETSAAISALSPKRKLGPEDFELLRVVGQGAFGKVFQVRKRDTREVFAMKVMRKDRILEKSHGEYVRAERDALTSVVHPYIVTLRYSFQTSQKLYLVLDFINGGHLFFQLYRAGTFDEHLACLYTAELVSAISYLHSLGFVHRDLKPENVLLDSHGHVKVTDFGLAKGNMSDAEHHRTNSFIGTMEYMAPEVIQGKGHGKAVDWWSIGILLYEMLNGMPPFRAKSRAALQKLIVAGKFKLPKYLSSEACSLLRALLQKDATKRLGFGPDGSEAVKGHPFFKSINWKQLDERNIESPFRPNIRSHDSVENFDKIWTDLPAHDSPCTTPTKNRIQDSSEFEGFTYCAPSLLAQLKLSPKSNR